MSFENYFIINFVHCWIDVFQVMSMEPWKTIFFIESSTGDSNPQPGLKSNHYLNLSLYYPSNYSFYWNIHIVFDSYSYICVQKNKEQESVHFLILGISSLML